jgi:UDP-glucuronate 4-epimerase
MTQRILLTGGAGFIGSHVTEALLARGDRVTVLDNFNDFYDPAIKRANLAHVRGAEVVTGDIRDAALVARLFASGAFDAVIHLAAMAGVRPSIQDPLHYEDVNVRGTLILLEELRRRSRTRFVFASSSSVYGDRARVPFREDDDIHHPVSPYAATKRAGELHAWTYHHLYGIATSCLRFFTVYGPRQRPEMAIHLFAKKILDGEPITIHGDGTSSRDYTYIEDCVQGVIASIDRAATTDGYRIYNLGCSDTTKLADLVAYLERALGKKAELRHAPDQPGDVPLTYADVSRARAELGYNPTTKIEAGVEKFARWLLRRRGGPRA